MGLPDKIRSRLNRLGIPPLQPSGLMGRFPELTVVAYSLMSRYSGVLYPEQTEWSRPALVKDVRSPEHKQSLCLLPENNNCFAKAG
ncbi:hypothetical protein VTK56DRAFT_6191 [Thermocarpiscus australiensis]